MQITWTVRASSESSISNHSLVMRSSGSLRHARLRHIQRRHSPVTPALDHKDLRTHDAGQAKAREVKEGSTGVVMREMSAVEQIGKGDGRNGTVEGWGINKLHAWF